MKVDAITAGAQSVLAVRPPDPPEPRSMAPQLSAVEPPPAPQVVDPPSLVAGEPGSVAERAPTSDVQLDLVQKVLDEVNAELNARPNSISIHRDEDTGMFIVQVIDKSSGEVLRELPPKLYIDAMAQLQELSGMLFAKEG